MTPSPAPPPDAGRGGIATTPEPPPPPSLNWLNWLLLMAAWVAALIVYYPVLEAHWFYDDSDYVLVDPRLDHLELFWPWHWNDPPPALQMTREGPLHLPGYGQPMIKDRFLWRLSFALEKRLLGPDYTSGTAHTVNLSIHQACIGALFFALWQLLALYLPFSKVALGHGLRRDSRVFFPGLLPGLGALAFAVAPWAAEPVCYVSARNASMGAFFALLGLGMWACALSARRSWLTRLPLFGGALLCALAAYSCKENFITALPGYVLATWPVLWQYLSRLGRARKAAVVGIACAALILAVALAGGLAWLGVSASGRASGLWNQVASRGWTYFFEIQNPLVLTALADQIPSCRLSLEANHPGWAIWACVAALAANTALILFGTLGGKRWPLLLGLAWFYLHLAPSNSFLPRPDFLAARNVYLPTAGIVTLVVGALLWLPAWLDWRTAEARSGPDQRPQGRKRLKALPEAQLSATGSDPELIPKATVALALLCLLICWAYKSNIWAQGFVSPEGNCPPEGVWARSALIAPDHGAVQLNLAYTILARRNPEPPNPEDRDDAEAHFKSALAAEDSPTMSYHTERPKTLRRALAARMLGYIHLWKGENALAEPYFRKSWLLSPKDATWVGWAISCLNANLTAALAEVIAEGEKTWPGAWWPRAIRGLQQAQQFQAGPLAEEARRNLEAAANAPPEPGNELRMLQNLAIKALEGRKANVPNTEHLPEEGKQH